MKKTTLSLLVLCLVQCVSAQTWIRQNPFPKLVQLQDIDFDGLHGLAVGDESTLFTTDNGGSTWRPRTAPIDQYTYDAALVVPGTNGQIMYAAGINLIVTHDGGETWADAQSGLANFHSLQALSNGTIMAHGQGSSVYTNDGGANWSLIDMPDFDVSASFFTDVSHGWVESGSFNNAQIWVTTDGGQSWNVRDTLRHPVITGIRMMNDQVGFMSARDFVYKTIDGGQEWVRLHNNAVNSIQDMYVVNENVIWTCLNNGFIFFTLDGGNIWQEINPNIINSNKTNGIYANIAGQVWVTGKFVSIMHSSNFGNDWTDQIPNSKAIMYQPHFFDEENGIVGASGGVLLKTDNGGASWEEIKFDENENFFAVQMINPQVMVIGSSSGRVFGTANGGQDWNMLGENLGQIVDLHALSLQTIVLVSESGKILKTTTAGSQWDEVYQTPGGLLQGVDFINAQQGWACGWFGEIVYSENGGDTWIPQESNGSGQFSDIHFTTPMDGWIVSSGFTDTIWHTTNGGLTWGKSKLPYGIFWHGVSFTSRDTGWIAGGSAGSGLILRTNNRGQTWTIDHQSPEGLFGLHALQGKETAWSCGVGGNIVKYSPCTFNPTLSNLAGSLMPCERDTVSFSVDFADVDLFEWTIPSDWLVFGNSNTSSIDLIVGSMPGAISVLGKDVCGNVSSMLSVQVSPVATPEAIITEENEILNCNLASGFYQWLLNGTPIPNANGQSFIPEVSGNYECIVTTFATGCEIRSNALFFIVTSTDQVGKNQFIIYPNPASARIWLSGLQKESNTAGLTVKFTSIEGRQIHMKPETDGSFDISSLVPGIYMMTVKESGVTAVFRVLILD